MFKWERWIENKEECKEAFLEYLEKGMVKEEEEKENLSKSHLKKTDYNLDFINNLLKQKSFMTGLLLAVIMRFIMPLWHY